MGDDHRERGLAESGRSGEQHVVGRPLAAAGGLEDEPELLPHAGLADHLLEAAGAEGGLDGALVALGLGGGQRAEVLLLGDVQVVLVHAQALLSVRRAARSSVPTSGVSPASGATASTASSASRVDQPSPTSPWWTWSRHGAAVAIVARAGPRGRGRSGP